MGRSITPTFRVEFRVKGRSYTPSTWHSKYSGRPSDATLAAWVASFEASTRPGGVNEHLGPETIFSANVIRQSSGETIATYEVA